MGEGGLFFCHIYDKISKTGGLNPPPYVISRMAGREKKNGAFLPISDMRVQKRPSKFFETKNIFFGGRSKFLAWSKTGFYLLKWDFSCPKLAKMSQKDEKW